MSDVPDFVTPGQPVEALWGNEVVASLRDAIAFLNSLLPIGMVAMFGGTVEPTNWLFCRGQAIAQASYSGLYAVVGDRFNAGGPAVPAGTFRVPNMQARYPVGTNVGSSWGQGTYWSGGGVGEIAGTYDPVMPYHQHTVPDHLHGLNNWTGGQNADHGHYDDGVGAYAMNAKGAFQVPLHYLPVGVGTDIGGPIYFHFSPSTGGTGNDHAHLLSGTTGASDRSLASGFAGGGAQIPPGVSYNFIIRAR
ncbi:MAG TPA: phage tail protein [Desertimonas sp.]|nr:phage tail protein [Desertimonas sp.]